jgi:phosphotriesterase-related protein
LGELPYEQMGVTDGHNHAWIDPVPGADPGAPVLNDYELIRDELRLYRAAGGQSLMDCQPPGCGRNVKRLAALSRDSGVHIVASTGFHRARYYPPGYELFGLSAERAADFFLCELTERAGESDGEPPARAGFIKIAVERLWSDTPQAALRGAAYAARQTGDLVEIHTEKGALAERVVLWLAGRAPRAVGAVPHGQAPRLRPAARAGPPRRAARVRHLLPPQV